MYHLRYVNISINNIVVDVFILVYDFFGGINYSIILFTVNNYINDIFNFSIYSSNSLGDFIADIKYFER